MSKQSFFAMSNEGSTLNLNDLKAVPADHPNHAAYELIINFFPADSTGNLYLYPTDKQTAQGLTDLVAAIKEATKDWNDAQLRNCISVLENVLAYSTKRHWTISWKLIVAAIVSVLILSLCVESSKKDVANAEAKVSAVKGWTLPSTKPEKLDITHNFTGTADFNEKSGIEAYRLYRLGRESNDYKYYMEQSAKSKAISDTASTKEAKKSAINKSKEYKKVADNHQKEYNKLAKLSWQDMHKEAIKYYEHRSDEAASSSYFMIFLYVFVIILIPLYIISQHPYGYTIMRCRREAETLEGIHKFATWISGGLFATGAGIGFIDIVTKWSNGKVTREDDGTGPARLAIKVLLFAAAVIVICIASCLIMTYATVVGLKRNVFAK